MSARDDSTNTTLLHRLALAPPDEAAWSDFVERYGPRIFQWCRGWSLQEADVLDVSQAVLVKLSVQLRRFDYDRSRSFRGWVRSIVRGAVQDALSARGLAVGTGTTDCLERLASVEARNDLVQRLEAEFDLELLDAAIQAVRQRVTPRTWQAYHLTAREGRPAAEVAKALGMRVGTVYQARSGVMRMLQEQVRKLEEGAEIRGPVGPDDPSPR
jgi:RNA polymerase sigma factor (sigma-70 family)